MFGLKNPDNADKILNLAKSKRCHNNNFEGCAAALSLELAHHWSVTKGTVMPLLYGVTLGIIPGQYLYLYSSNSMKNTNRQLFRWPSPPPSSTLSSTLSPSKVPSERPLPSNKFSLSQYSSGAN